MYEFNQEIIEALKAGKSVWARNTVIKGNWFEFTEKELNNYNITVLFKYDWSLTKPKVKVKKEVTLYINDKAIELLKDKMWNYFFMSENFGVDYNHPITITWEQEEE